MEDKDKEEIQGFKTKLTGVDPETGKMSWDVSYQPDYEVTFKAFKDLFKKYKKFSEHPEVRKDQKFLELYKGINYLYNQFRTHLRANYPKKYSQLKSLDENQIKDLIHAKLKEMSATGAGAGAGHFEPGTGANYATPNAFNPNKKAKGAQNIYYYKLGWKPVNAKALHAKAKGIEHKDLWKENIEKETWINFIGDPKLKEKVEQEVKYYDEIESKLNTLLPLLKKIKAETIQTLQDNPQSAYSPEYGADMAVEYLNDIITLFSKESRIK
jgi:hypothetical protein